VTRTIRPISFADTTNSEMYTREIPAQFLENQSDEKKQDKFFQ
jgi:hypothetical protein